MSVTPTDKPGIAIGPPPAPELAKLWALARAKFEAAHAGVAPATRADWNAVTAEYHRLTSKPAGPLAEVLARVIKERCSEVRGADAGD